MDYPNRIKKLEREYSETNIKKGEKLSKETRSKINKKYYSNQQRRFVDTILNDVKNKDTVKQEVHEIVKENNLKELCKNCREELIIAVIILYCLKMRNSDYKLDKSRLWKKYGVTWQKYSLIVSRLLMKTREKSKLKVTKIVDNNLIEW